MCLSLAASLLFLPAPLSRSVGEAEAQRLVVTGARAASAWLWTTAYAIPKETTSEESGYFSIVAGKNGRLYIGTAKYRQNAYLVEFDPKSKRMRVVVDAQHEIGTTATGFAAQAKIHTRNNVGASGKIYFGTKQGYPQAEEKRTDYPGGYPMVYDPATGRTRVYPIPIPHQGIISILPDESRGIAYLSTCSDERPIESSHFMILDLARGTYRDLLDCRHMFAFLVLDHLGRAYHPILGGEIARYDPRTDRLERLKQTIDGKPPTAASLLALPESHPINWEVSPDHKTLYAVAMSGNQLYAYDLTAAGDTLPGRSLGKLLADAETTDCRAFCVGPDGTVWAGVAATYKGRDPSLHLVSYRPGDAAPRDHGPLAIRNPDYTTFVGADGKPLPWHHGVYKTESGVLVPRYVIMGICATRDRKVYLTTLYPFTLHEIRVR
jgi:outer membrane protein assembly factor BamB